ncbi:flagellar biosynthesis/type III secretory pathway M-ring protein FliF/YscJ [Bacillus sp. RC97]
MELVIAFFTVFIIIWAIIKPFAKNRRHNTNHEWKNKIGQSLSTFLSPMNRLKGSNNVIEKTACFVSLVFITCLTPLWIIILTFDIA